jgi:hypothetical protein
MKTAFLVASLAALALLTPSAHATFPGANGKIAYYASGGTYTIDPDGANKTLAISGASEVKWSPDGTKIAYRGSGWGMVVSNPDGTGTTGLSYSGDVALEAAWSPTGTQLIQREQAINACPAPDPCDPPDPPFLARPSYPSGYTYGPGNEGYSADWSPDGTKIAYVYSGTIYAEAPEGGSVTAIGSGSQPSWSPDAHRIAYVNGGEIWVMHADGTGAQQLTTRATLSEGFREPVWSPDGTKIAFVWVQYHPADGSTDSDIAVMNADGSGAARITSGTPSYFPDWQPLPINSYPRPRGASPMRLPLVPANRPCTTPNRTHGAPLSFGSCAPPQLTSTELTTGTPDSNGKRHDGGLPAAERDARRLGDSP